MDFIAYCLLPILGGMLAASSVIVARVPDAEAVINKFAPYKAIIGVIMLGIGVLVFFKNFRDYGHIIEANYLLGLTYVAGNAALIVIGFMFGMPLIANKIPGDSEPEKVALEWQKKLLPFEATAGFISLAAGVVFLLFQYIF